MVGAVIVYQVYFAGGKDNSVLVSKSGDEISGSVIGREIITFLDDLQSINLDGSIFDDPAFVSLVDFEKEVQAEPVGRDNPFDPF